MRSSNRIPPGEIDIPVAVILAASEGSRLRNGRSSVPKPLVRLRSDRSHNCSRPAWSDLSSFLDVTHRLFGANSSALQDDVAAISLSSKLQTGRKATAVPR